MIRVIPDIPRIHAHWDRRSSEIPTWLEVPMSDGRKVRYIPDVDHPGVERSIEGIRRIGKAIREAEGKA